MAVRAVRRVSRFSERRFHYGMVTTAVISPHNQLIL